MKIHNLYEFNLQKGRHSPLVVSSEYKGVDRQVQIIKFQIM